MKLRHILIPLALVLLLSSCSSQPSYDIIVENGSLIDGSGSEARDADVGILDGKIAAIGDLAAAGAERRIDATGLVVAPGFVDMHNHSDLTIIDEPNGESMVRQGVTTMILGEGGSEGPRHPGEKEWETLGEYFDFVEAKGLSQNIASYVGQTQIWTFIKGEELKPATDEETQLMREEVEKAMRQGALGLSTSLLMPPSSLVTTEQLIEMAKGAAAYGGLYSTHTRDEGAGIFDSVTESIAVGRGADIRVDMIHLKIADNALWTRMSEVLKMLDDARADGVDMRANVYPYTAGSNNLRAIIPPWAHDGGNEAMVARLRDPSQRAHLRRDILNGLPGWYNHYLAVGGDWERMLLVNVKQESNKQWIGKRMSEVIASRVGDPIGVFLDFLAEEEGSVPTVYFHHTEADMQLAMQWPYTTIGSDGSATSIDGPRASMHPHPRWYGTFPRVLGRYVRELHTLTLPEAIKKMTSMNAEKANLSERGLIKEGYWADVTLFDPETVIDKATFEKPHQYPEGIPYVIINGVVTLDNHEHTNSRSGMVLRGPGYQAETE